MEFYAMRFYVRGEDLVIGYIGPFDTMQGAATHIVWCEDHGSGSDMRVITEDEVDRNELIMTPEEDRASMLKLEAEDRHYER